MRVVLVGPGRAGMSLAIAAAAAEHDVVAVVGRSFDSAERGADIVGATPLTVNDPIPESDLMLVATRDAAIEPVAARLARHPVPVPAAVHLSGLTPVSALAPLADQGIAIGSFHPLQTLPSPEAGAARLAPSSQSPPDRGYRTPSSSSPIVWEQRHSRSTIRPSRSITLLPPPRPTSRLLRLRWRRTCSRKPVCRGT